MMQTRAVGRTAIQLSVVGFGTAQLQMLPERQAVETLVRGFELGVNWIHTAPDYGGIDPWIRRAIDRARRDVMVLSSGPGRNEDLPAFFEHTCHIHRTRRLAMYGLAGIEDLEWRGENVWDSAGMIEYLQNRKAEGRLGAIYCSTHASADYVAKLIDTGVFDAIMLAWNPLGFHQQSHPWARAKINRDYEDLTEYRERIFPLAAARGVSLLIMKPFAGGLLCPS
jgi:predicted aldo/keto reductase-like oxidoreductase